MLTAGSWVNVQASSDLTATNTGSGNGAGFQSGSITRFGGATTNWSNVPLLDTSLGFKPPLGSRSHQVNNNAAITLSGGTITRGSGVSETFGALDLTGASTLDFGSGIAGNLTFGAYEGNAAPSAILTLNNFFGGNSLVLGSDISGYLTPGTYNTGSFTNSHFVINSVSGGFTASVTGSTFTITAIPEPSTCLAAAGLLGLMLWPARHRLLRRLGANIAGGKAPARITGGSSGETRVI